MKRNATSIGFTVDTYEGIPPSIIIAGLKFIGMDFIELTKTVFSDINAVSSKNEWHACQFSFTSHF